MKNKILILSIIVLPLLIYAVLSYIDAKDTANLPIEKPAYASIGENYIDKVTIYKFYSPMCSDCVKQSQEMTKIDDKYSKYYEIIEVNVSENKTNGAKTQKYIDDYDIVTVPTLVFVDSNNNILRKYVGFTPVDKIHEGIEANK